MLAYIKLQKTVQYLGVFFLKPKHRCKFLFVLFSYIEFSYHVNEDMKVNLKLRKPMKHQIVDELGKTAECPMHPVSFLI